MSAPATDLSSARTTVRRRSGRGRYERELINAILDEALTGQLAFASDGQPYSIPMLHVRVGETIYLHGSPLSRLMGTAVDGAPMCFTVTLLDGLVLARSAFHHSLNYRSVMVLGGARAVRDRAEKLAALGALVEHLVPGRASEARGPSSAELEATEVVALALQEASAKVRTGPPVDAPEDYSMRVWAGEIPLRLIPGEPAPDPRCAVSLPDYVRVLLGGDT